MVVKLNSYRGSFPKVLNVWKLVSRVWEKREKETKKEKHLPAGYTARAQAEAPGSF